MSRGIKAGMAVLLALVTAPVAAQDGEGGSRVQAAVTAGTLGIGPEVGIRLSDHVGLRGSATFLGVGGSYESDDLSYDGRLRLNSFGGTVDVYPFGGHFRLSGGARVNNNRILIAATPAASSTVEIGDTAYAAAQVGTLTGRATPNRLSPMLTLGWAGKNRRGFFFGLDSGVLFQGAYRLKDFRASGPIGGNAGFQASLERERLTLQDDVDKVKIWPVVQLSLGWRF